MRRAFCFLLVFALVVPALTLGPAFAEEEKAAKEGAKEGGEDKDKKIGPPVVDFDPMIINLSEPPDKRTKNYLKITMALELAHAEDIPKVEAKKPILIDTFEVYLRELRVEDLQGSVGIIRLRGEILQQIRAAIAPVEAKELLFKEILVQ